MSKNAERKYNQRKRLTSKVMQEQDTWSKLVCSKHLTRRATILLNEQWQLRNKYKSQRISYTEWKIMYSSYDEDTYETIIPVFKRIRTLKYVNGYIKCDCCYFERHGIPCRHMFHLSTHIPGYDEPTHHDVTVRYWKEYLYYSNSNKKCSQDIYNDLSRMIKLLQCNDCSGLFVPEDKPS